LTCFSAIKTDTPHNQTDSTGQVKNQYFGDINDYRKYGLLRLLINGEEIKTAVCWMLTPDHGRGDGGFIEYLENPDRWRKHDPDLYDHLRELVHGQSLRDTRAAETSAILPACRFAPGFLPDDGDGRRRYFDAFNDVAEGCDLVFFDPDNGIEVKLRVGRKGSSKYLYWDEIERFWKAGHSVLIYQHFPHVKRAPFIGTKARQLADTTGAPLVISFRTPHVVFFLVPQAERRNYFRGRSAGVAQRWGSEIRVAYHSW
jgi:hypothetical protein